MAIKTPEHPEVAADLREAQRKKGYSNARLARLAGVSRKHLDEVLNGSNVSVRILRKVMAALQLDHLHLGNLGTASGALHGVSPEVLLVLADEMETALQQAVQPMHKQIATLRAYATGSTAPELASKTREAIRKTASDPATKTLAKKAAKRQT